MATMMGEPIDRPEKRISMRACSILNDMRKDSQLCDAVIRVEDGHFTAHRAVMSACSPNFRALFTNEPNKRETVFIPGVNSDMMGLIIDYAYTGDKVVTPENAKRLLPAAGQFQMLGLVKRCCDQLAVGLDVDNCIGIRNIARNYSRNLERKANWYIMEHFAEIATRSDEILTLTDEEMIEMISSDDLNVKNEEIVFECVIRWINHDPDNRKQHIAKLLRCVRLGLLSTQYFVETVKKHPLVHDNEQCKFLSDLDTKVGRNVDLTNPIARPRVLHEVMFVIGGWSAYSAISAVEIYDTRADRWITVEHADRGPRAYHGCATVDMLIYVIGGYDGKDNYFKSVRCFNPHSKKWTEVAHMNSRRCYVSVAVLDGCIYAMGGYDGHVRQKTAERYTPKSNKWRLITPMNHQRSDASATTLNGKVYIAGGFDGQEVLNTAECYDPETREWTMIAPMRSRRSGIGVIAHDGFVYAIGGYNGDMRTNNGEKYNPLTNSWSNITAEMHSPRSNFAIEVIDNMVFAIGGFDGDTQIFNVECYDPLANEWYDRKDMNNFRSASSACVVRGLPSPNVYDDLECIDNDRNKAEKKKKGSK